MDSFYLGAEYLSPKKVNLSIMVGLYKPKRLKVTYPATKFRISAKTGRSCGMWPEYLQSRKTQPPTPNTENPETPQPQTSISKHRVFN